MKHKLTYQKVQQFNLFIYLGLMLGFFPICYHFQYKNMGNFKYNVFLIATVLFLCFSLFNLFFSIIEKNCYIKFKKVTNLDWAVLGFFIANCLSFIFSPTKTEAFWGSPGWYTGFLMYLLLTAVYFVISKSCVEEEKKNNLNINQLEKFALKILLISSFLVYSLGLLHRFNIDPLNIYGNLPEQYRIEFLSTIGQSSWYSSFLCTVWPIGLYFFYKEKKRYRRICYGLYTVIGAMSLVTQNTDTAFLSLAVVLLFLFYIAQKGEDGIVRFLECFILVLVAFIFTGLLQRIFPQHMVPLESISIFISQSSLCLILLIISLAVYLYLKLKTSTFVMKEFLKSRNLFWGIISFLGVFIFLLFLFIVLNSNGYLIGKFGYQIKNSYLFFDYNWGNLRGFSWKLSLYYYQELSPFRKIIGVGPDCFSVYIQKIPDLFNKVQQFFGGLILTNAHNEYLTKLINLGALGLFSYFIMLFTSVKQFLKYEKEESISGAFALISVSYMAHMFFTYEQVCCTPLFFILIAIGNKIFYNEVNNRK